MPKIKKSKAHYVDTNELEKTWAKWLCTGCPLAWDRLQQDIYKICNGIAIKFNPKDEEEHMELAHETYVQTIEKIRSKRLVFEPGRAPVFNLLTTTIFRHLYSFMNKKNRRKKLLMTKYLERPGVLETLVCVSDISGIPYRHPESERLLSNIMPQLLDGKAQLAQADLQKKKSKRPSPVSH